MCANVCKYAHMSTNYSTGKAAEYLGVSVKTLQRWDREGILKPSRSPTGRRLYAKAELDACLKQKRTDDADAEDAKQ